MLCCGARRITFSMTSKDATNTIPEFIMRKGILKLENSGVIIAGSIFQEEIKLM